MVNKNNAICLSIFLALKTLLKTSIKTKGLKKILILVLVMGFLAATADTASAARRKKCKKGRPNPKKVAVIIKNKFDFYMKVFLYTPIGEKTKIYTIAPGKKSRKKFKPGGIGGKFVVEIHPVDANGESLPGSTAVTSGISVNNIDARCKRRYRIPLRNAGIFGNPTLPPPGPPPGPPPLTFSISNVAGSTVIYSGEAGGDLSVFWSGNPTFPVTMSYFLTGTCPLYYSCVNPQKTFVTSTNPLVFMGAQFCGVVSQSGNYHFPYSVQLTDSNGVKTNVVGAGVTCANFP